MYYASPGPRPHHNQDTGAQPLQERMGAYIRQCLVADIQSESTGPIHGDGATWWDTQPMLSAQEHCDQVLDLHREALALALELGVAHLHPDRPSLVRLEGV